jgi:capsular exopolysaccharide synthesis family protein
LFRILRTQVLKALRKIDGTTLGVCSANAGEGKTFVATNLAASIALSQEQPVLLLDLDLRRPGVHELFKLESTPGVTEFLAGQASLTECVRQTALDKLQIFPAGHPIRNSSEALGSTQLASIFDQLRKAIPGRILVCDMPPLLTSDDTLMFSSKLDATILVVAEGQTRPGEIQRSLELLDAGTVIGTVLNKSKINNAFPYSAYGS